MVTFTELEKELDILHQLDALLNYDLETQMPPSAIKQRSETSAYVALKSHNLLHSTTAKQLINKLSKQKLPEDKARKVELYKKEQDKYKRVPASFVEKLEKLKNESQHVWAKARKEDNVALFLPYLKKIFEAKKQLAKYIDPKKPTYDVLLDYYEEGMNTTALDNLFGRLKPRLIELNKNVKNPKLPIIKASNEKQTQLVEALHDILIPDKTRFNHGIVVHPFMTRISADDIRVTTGLREDVLFAFSSTAHECGHALYELQTKKEFRGTAIQSAISYGMHESQSRFMELQACSSKEFWKGFAPKANKILGTKHSVQKWYDTVNQISNSLIRIEGDEITYCLHIIIRYELERAILEGKLKLTDVEAEWNKKYKAYFGKSPKKPSQGVLQDVHWSLGYIGYFPTYALGTIRAAMIHKKLCKTSWYKKDLQKNDFTKLRKWLETNVHQYAGLYPPKELLQKIFKEEDNVDTYVEYLEDKYL